MSVYVDAGCDSDQHLLSVGAHRREPYRFAGGGVEDDPADTRVDRRPQFGNRFGIAVQDDSVGVHARGKRDGEFTGGTDIHPPSPSSETQVAIARIISALPAYTISESGKISRYVRQRCRTSASSTTYVGVPYWSAISSRETSPMQTRPLWSWRVLMGHNAGSYAVSLRRVGRGRFRVASRRSPEGDPPCCGLLSDLLPKITGGADLDAYLTRRRTRLTRL